MKTTTTFTTLLILLSVGLLTADATLTTVALTGDTAPGTSDSFTFLGVPVLNDVGQTAFLGDLDSSNSTDSGIWAQDPSGVLTLIARQGDLLDVENGVGKSDRHQNGARSLDARRVSYPCSEKNGGPVTGYSADYDLRTDLHDDRYWKETQMYANLIVGGFDEWLHSVRNSGSETWSCLWLLRRIGAPRFQPADRQLIDLAMHSIPWLGATLDNSYPVEPCVALTSRQRIVLMMQLDGLS